MARTRMTDQERKAKALAYSQDRAARLVAAGACRMCAVLKGTGTKVSLREPKTEEPMVEPQAAPAITDKPKAEKKTAPSRARQAVAKAITEEVIADASQALETPTAVEAKATK